MKILFLALTALLVINAIVERSVFMKKKIFFSLILVIMLFSMISPVLAANISSCDAVISSNVMIDEKIPSTVHTIVLIIKIAVPVLLVIFGSIDLLKGVIAAKEDEIKKGQQVFIKRLIAGALVFFVFVVSRDI